jgi:transketolase
VDYNHSGDRALKVGDLRAKFEAFGWESLTIDGHDHKAIEKALKTKTAEKPIAIIAETIKGLGASMMENNPAWHHRAPNAEEFNQILKELS